jgi:hypothetical protein
MQIYVGYLAHLDQYFVKKRENVGPYRCCEVGFSVAGKIADDTGTALLLGFVSVSYQSSTRGTYAEIVESRGYLIEKNQEQISSSLLSIPVAVLFWDVVVLLILKYAQDGGTESQSRQVLD